MIPDAHLPSPLVELRGDERLTGRGLRMLVKRDDLIHADLPGNKWRKLHLNLRAALDGGHRRLLTFGGAYSNHLRATAAAGRLLGIATIGCGAGRRAGRTPAQPLAGAGGRGRDAAALPRPGHLPPQERA